MLSCRNLCGVGCGATFISASSRTLFRLNWTLWLVLRVKRVIGNHTTAFLDGANCDFVFSLVLLVFWTLADKFVTRQSVVPLSYVYVGEHARTLLCKGSTRSLRCAVRPIFFAVRMLLMLMTRIDVGVVRYIVAACFVLVVSKTREAEAQSTCLASLFFSPFVHSGRRHRLNWRRLGRTTAVDEDSLSFMFHGIGISLFVDACCSDLFVFCRRQSSRSIAWSLCWFALRSIVSTHGAKGWDSCALLVIVRVVGVYGVKFCAFIGEKLELWGLLPLFLNWNTSSCLLDNPHSAVEPLGEARRSDCVFQGNVGSLRTALTCGVCRMLRFIKKQTKPIS